METKTEPLNLRMSEGLKDHGLCEEAEVNWAVFLLWCKENGETPKLIIAMDGDDELIIWEKGLTESGRRPEIPVGYESRLIVKGPKEIEGMMMVEEGDVWVGRYLNPSLQESFQEFIVRGEEDYIKRTEYLLRGLQMNGLSVNEVGVVELAGILGFIKRPRE